MSETLDGRPVRPPGFRAQVAAWLLAAMLPIAWLVGRRTAPLPTPQPYLARAEEAPIALPESARGLAANADLPRLPEPTGTGGAYRLVFQPAGSSGAGTAPFRVRLQSPDGTDLWQAVVSGQDGGHRPAELILPRSALRPGRYALVSEDAKGTMHSFLFIVP
jgi:hypothetical protein